MVELANNSLIRVLKDALFREKEKIRRAEQEIWNLKQQLYDLGVEISDGD